MDALVIGHDSRAWLCFLVHVVSIFEENTKSIRSLAALGVPGCFSIIHFILLSRIQAKKIDQTYSCQRKILYVWHNLAEKGKFLKIWRQVIIQK